MTSLLRGNCDSPSSNSSPSPSPSPSPSSPTTINDDDNEQYSQLLQVREQLQNSSPPFELAYDDLTIQEELGEGFFGKVHKAIYKKTAVAVKKITRSSFREKSDLDLFNKEISIMSKIHNKNCVLFIGVCNDPQNRCIVSEYCAGGSLHELLGRPYMITNSLRRCISIEIANAFTYLHQYNPPIIHRDLTSNNVLLSKNLHAKIADFGLSRERNDAMTTAVGSLSYMAPEAFLGLPYNETVDVYSFGQLLYELVSGQEPHKGMTSQRFAFLVAIEDFRQSLLGFTQPMQDLISMCWHRKPENRPSFSTICSVLDKLTENDFIRIPTDSPVNSISSTYQAGRKGSLPKLPRVNSNIVPSRSNSNVSMSSPPQFSDPCDSPSSPLSSSPSGKRALATSTEEVSDSPYSQYGQTSATTHNVVYENNPTNVYSNYSAYGEAGQGGYYHDTSSRSSFTCVETDDDIYSCVCLDKDNPKECPLLGESQKLEGHKKSVKRLRGDGAQNDFVLSCSEDCTVRVWPLSESCKQKQGVIANTTPITAVQGVRLGPKGIPFIVSGDEKGDMVLWETRHFKKIRTIKAHVGTITNFAWGGTRLLSSGSDTSVKLWDLERGVCSNTFNGHSSKVNDVHCDTNQVLIISSSDDGTIKLWDSRIGKDFRTLRVHSGAAVLCAKMRSTGRDNILVSGSDTGQVSIWDMHAPYCITTHPAPTNTNTNNNNNNNNTQNRVVDVDFDNTHGIVFATYSSGCVRLIDSSSWSPIHSLDLSSSSSNSSCNSMVFAQQSLVTGFEDGTVVVSKLRIDI